LSKKHPKLKSDLNRALNDGHSIMLIDLTLEFEIYLRAGPQT
jgi:hypothetical protein